MARTVRSRSTSARVRVVTTDAASPPLLLRLDSRDLFSRFRVRSTSASAASEPIWLSVTER